MDRFEDLFGHARNLHRVASVSVILYRDDTLSSQPAAPPWGSSQDDYAPSDTADQSDDHFTGLSTFIARQNTVINWT